MSGQVNVTLVQLDISQVKLDIIHLGNKSSNNINKEMFCSSLGFVSYKGDRTAWVAALCVTSFLRGVTVFKVGLTPQC